MRARPVATADDAQLVAEAVKLFGSQLAAAAASGVAQCVLSRASKAGRGRSLNDIQRRKLLVIVGRWLEV